jgi:serine/threonine-protein kinase
MDQTQVLAGRYEIEGLIARGGMADVFAARDRLLGRRVAIKVLHPQYSADDAFVRRFRREAQAAANLSHPNIVSIYDWGEDGATYFIVMELIDGRSLRDVLRSDGPLLPRRSAEIAAEASSALAVAHRAGLVHRDVKPGNILLARDGTVKVADFGIARAWDDSQELTRTGAVIGTASYFSPEQAQGAPVDARSDVYSLGVVLYEMLAGRPPFQGESPLAVAYQHVSSDPAAPSTENNDVPTSLDAIALRAMAKNPDDRYQSADDMRRDLLGFLRGETPVAAAAVGTDEATQMYGRTEVPPPTVPPDEAYRAASERRGSQLPFILTAFGLLLLLGLGLFLLFRQLQSEPEPVLVPVPQVEGMAEQEALSELQGDGFRIASIVREFSDEFDSGIAIRTEPPAGTEIEEGSEVTLVVSQGQEVFGVPPLVGLTLDEARQLLEAQELELGNVTEQPSDSFAEGLITAQDPPPGSNAPEGTTVDVVVSSGRQSFTLDDYRGFTEDQVRAELGALGLTADIRNEASADVADGQVIRTEPPAGSTVRAGDTVVVFLSSGPEPVEVPDLSGLTPGEAQARLADSDLRYAEAGTRPVDDPGLDGRVVDQSPSAGESVEPGAVVTVILGEGPPPTTEPPTTVPPPTVAPTQP